MATFQTFDPGHFAVYLKEWVDVKARSMARVNTLALLRGIYSMILVESPVKEGKFRINTKFGVNAIDATSTTKPARRPTPGSDPNSGEWLSSGYASVKSAFKMGDTVNISNSVRVSEGSNSYANRVEYDGWANTGAYAPFGKALVWASANAARAVLYGKNRGAAA